MPSLKSDLVRRIERLPKPVRTGDALLPLFEAISNSIHSVQERYKTRVSKRGNIDVTVARPFSHRPLTITVADNGIGLDDRNFEAFCTTDTDHKINVGGKGVGRLLWLDCFQQIQIESVYQKDDQLRRRSFDFSLKREEQITNYSERALFASEPTGMVITFSGLRDNGYSAKFPNRLGHIFRHVTSHFLPTFIGNRCPKIAVTCEGDTRTYPEAMDSYIHRKEEMEAPNSPEFGHLRLVMMECDKIASADLQGKHFVHFIAHDRTVLSQAIDSKLGLRFFGEFYQLSRSLTHAGLPLWLVR